MTGILYAAATTLLGISLGYQATPDGSGEYILQVEPIAVQSLRPNDTLTSRIPPDAQDRHFDRIVFRIGDGQLPKDLPPRPAISNAASVNPNVQGNGGPANSAQGFQNQGFQGQGSQGQGFQGQGFQGQGNPGQNYQGSAQGFQGLGNQGPGNPSQANEPQNFQGQAGPGQNYQQGYPGQGNGGQTFVGSDGRTQFGPSNLPSQNTLNDRRAAAPGGTLPAEPDKPWLLLSVIAIALFCSNVYLGWIFVELRNRYRSLLGTTASR